MKTHESITESITIGILAAVIVIVLVSSGVFVHDAITELTALLETHHD